MTLRVFSGKLSGTSTYLKDVLHPPEVSDGNNDGWGHECDVDVDADAEVMLSYWVVELLCEKLLSGTCPYFEDILHPPLVPDGWDHLHWLDFAWGFQKYVILWVENCCQEPPHTWRMSSILMRSLIVILMVGVIFAEPDVDVDVDTDSDGMLSWKWGCSVLFWTRPGNLVDATPCTARQLGGKGVPVTQLLTKAMLGHSLRAWQKSE